jgi:hypothetical protein
MHGRFFIGLLIISSLILSLPPAGRAQSDQILRTSDRIVRGPEDPANVPPRRLPTPLRPLPIPVRPVGIFQMSRAAGMIFSGRVTAIARTPTSLRQAIETVAVTFHVEHAIRGVRNGDLVTIRQWAGLWSGRERYQIGERLLLFLYPPSRLGLTSPIGGDLGRFNVDSLGWVSLSERHRSAFAADPVLAGKSRVAFNDFAEKVRRVMEEE